MKLEYLNGVRISKLYHEMTPLEAAINRYDKIAKNHYSHKNKNLNLTGEERKAELIKSQDFLGNERRHLETIAEVQASLVMYRNQGMAATKGTNKEQQQAIAIMKSEEHHPTKDLERLMRAEGIPKPSRHHTAHHILPGKGRWQQVNVARARVHMHVYGIRINDPANGVYLLYKDEYTPHWSMPKSRGHLKYHTAEYEELVSRRVRLFRHIDFIKTELQIIGRILQSNEPKDALLSMTTR